MNEEVRSLILDSSSRQKFERHLRTSADETTALNSKSSLPTGISVVMASYRGYGRIQTALDSIANQTLDNEYYELIVVVNGTEDGTTKLLTEFQSSLSELNIRVAYTGLPSAGGARNLGLSLARFSHVTFLDDDDFLQPEFLKSGFELLSSNNVVLLPIVNINEDAEIDEHTVLNERIKTLAGKRVPLDKAAWALGFNACKILPTDIARRFKYVDELTSGEDLVYFSNLLEVDDLALVVPEVLSDSAYVRAIRENSVSRRADSLEFNVVDRLRVIAALELVAPRLSGGSLVALRQLKAAQAGFIQRFAKNNPSHIPAIHRAISNSDVKDVFWEMPPNDAVDDLAFLYCFAPFSDTSAIVASKVLAHNKKQIDVISNDMSTVRRLDPGVAAIARPWINNHVVIDTKASFAGWREIALFGTHSINKAESLRGTKGPYKTMYSRAVWIGSHVAAALYKLKYPQTRWTAEFSDPLRRGTQGEERAGAYQDDYVSKTFLAALRSRRIDTTQIGTLFDLVEIVTFVFADELIFTNGNQRKFMLSLYGNKSLRNLVEEKSVIRPHPVPEQRLFEISESAYEVPTGVINIAYFGAFYPNRGISDILVAISNMSADTRKHIRFHVFANKPQDVSNFAQQVGVTANVYASGYLPYLEFLSVAKKLDVLLVNDTETEDYLSVNPFLPSKYADYLGAGSDIWAVEEKGSPLSRADGIRYRSQVGNVPSMIRTLDEIASDYVTSD